MVIYKTTNLINDKFYVGKDSKNDSNYYGSGLLLNNAIKKYGKDNFKKEILEECNSLEELSEKERYWIKKLNARNKKLAYNIGEGGDGGDNFFNHPNLNEIKQKISDSNKGREAWNKGLKNIYSEKQINRLKESREKYKGKNHPRYVEIDLNLLQKKLNKLKIKEVADFFGVSISVIRKRINENNLVVIKKSGNFEKILPIKTISKIIELRENKLTITEIAKIIGIGINKTTKILKENKVSTKRIK